MARDEGWLAEHMLILKLTSPEGVVKYIAGGVPERVRQDQPGDADPDAARLEGRDDRRRHRLDEVRRGRPAVRGQPRGRLLRRRAGHRRDAPTRTRSTRSSANTIFTNCAKTDDGDVWWEGMTGEPPAHAIDWRGNDWTPDVRDAGGAPERALHRLPRAQCPSIAPEWEDPAGVPIDAILFGGRRATVVPLVHEARDWEHGVFLGSIMSSETTAAAAGEVGKLRFDPMAMLPFCGYHMADYFAPLARDRPSARAPSCRGSSTSTGSARTTTASSCGPASARTRACWRGSSAAARATPRRSRPRSAWCRRSARAASTPTGLDVERRDDARSCSRSTPTAGSEQLPQMQEHYAKFGDKLPAELRAQLEALEQRLRRRLSA